MNFTIKQLRAFVTVAEFESFNLAANRLHLTPGAVSSLVRELEAQLGFLIFDRTTRRVTLSKAGRDFLPSAVAVLRELQTAALSANDVKNRATGVVRVAAPLVVGAAILPPAMAAYRQSKPDVMVRPVDCTVEEMVRMVESDRADIALGPDRPLNEVVEQHSLYDSPWVLWCAPGHPLAAKKRVTWKDLASEAVVAAGRDYENRIFEALSHAPSGDRFDPTFVVDNVTTALGIAAAGLGVTLSPSYVSVLAKKMGLVMKRVSAPEVVRQLCLFTPRTRSVTPATAAFIEFLSAYLRRNASTLSSRKVG